MPTYGAWSILPDKFVTVLTDLIELEDSEGFQILTTIEGEAAWPVIELDIVN